MIDDVLQNAAAMGLTVVRTWGFLDGAPSNGVVMQSLPGVYPEDGYERFDYAVSKAAQLGLKLVVPLVNNWDAFGGMNQYVTWFGGTNHDDFYTNPQIRAAYKQYIQHFLSRTNRYTGRKMLDEPAIMTWELANEPAANPITQGIPCFIPDSWKKDQPWALQWITDHIRDGHALGKPVVLEEFGWTDLTTRDAIYRTWIDTIFQANGDGDQFWILTGLRDDGTLYPNYDGFRVTNPSSTANIISAHAAQMQAKSV